MSNITNTINALGLLRSTIKSGEEWTEQCEAAYQKAIDDTVSLTAELEALWKSGAEDQEIGSEWMKRALKAEAELEQMKAEREKMKCKHGIRWPHECKDCEHDLFWAAAIRQRDDV